MPLSKATIITRVLWILPEILMHKNIFFAQMINIKYASRKIHWMIFSNLIDIYDIWTQYQLYYLVLDYRKNLFLLGIQLQSDDLKSVKKNLSMVVIEDGIKK